MSTDQLFEDAEDDPRWQWAGLTVGAPLAPSKNHIVCSLAWLQQIWPVVHTPTHLVVALVLYSKCLRQRSQTVALSNRELKQLGISRYAKYRTLAWLQKAGVLTVEKTSHGQSIRVTLHRFP